MYILVTYDVDTISLTGQKRLRQVAKACKNYGQRVQNSVFECKLTEVQLVKLQYILSQLMDPDLDSIRIYHLGNNANSRTIKMGKVTSYNVDDTLIL